MGGGDSIVVFNIYRIVFLFHSTARVLVSWDGAREREGGGGGEGQRKITVCHERGEMNRVFTH